ncbi:hypothetical protein BX600DRAFT_507762 [Xylariales sp. PMI_506]|nr:hypothetical protein BX600DRAFT_507762 [Xylariales sp. PMI_506]
MFTHRIAAVALSALTLVSAAGNFTIDPTSVDITTRASWCISEENTCSEVCGGSAGTNSCDDTELTYVCTCGDGTTPAMEDYKNSLPYLICEEAYSQCIDDTVGDAAAQQNCTTTIQDECGTKNASSAATTTTTTSASTATAASSSAASTSATSTSTAGAVPTAIQHLGNGAIAVAVGLAAFMI